MTLSWHSPCERRSLFARMRQRGVRRARVCDAAVALTPSRGRRLCGETLVRRSQAGVSGAGRLAGVRGPCARSARVRGVAVRWAGQLDPAAGSGSRGGRARAWLRGGVGAGRLLASHLDSDRAGSGRVVVGKPSIDTADRSRCSTVQERSCACGLRS